MTTPTPTQPATPVTDVEIADIRRRAEQPNPRTGVPVGLHNYHAMVAPFIVRIEAESKSNAELRAEVERLKKVRTGSAVERLHNLCDGFEEMDDRREAELTALRSRLARVEEAGRAWLANTGSTKAQDELARALESILSGSEGVKS
jgi:hypothetical protein